MFADQFERQKCLPVNAFSRSTNIIMSHDALIPENKVTNSNW